MHTLPDQLTTHSEGNKRPDRFQTLIFRRLFFAALGLAIITAFIYSYLTALVIKDFYTQEGTQATENFAHLSELALLYESGENSREAAIATLNFPSIKHVAIIDSQGEIIFDEGNTSDEILSSLKASDWTKKSATIFSSTNSTWQIAAPVFTIYNDISDNELILDEEPTEEIYLGYVAIQIDADTVRDIQYQNFVSNLFIGLIYGIIFALIISYTLSRLLKPMSGIAKVMHASKDGDYRNIEIQPSAALEIQQIAGVYNQMISSLGERDQRLRGQRDLLETEVALRTSELIQARDAALEANRHKSEFLANITHELRTPLQSILGYTELINETLEDECIVDCDSDIEKITRNAQHLLTLINSILDIAKIEAGKMEVKHQLCNLNELVNDAAATVKPLIDKNSNQLLVNAGSIKEPVYIDEQKVFQILLNLLSNAAKFTENGTISVDVVAINMGLKIIVRDTGIGISEEQKKSIFEPFRQVDGSESRKFVGTGLGLSIVLRLTELLDGKIELNSKIDVGSSFTVTIPLGQQSASVLSNDSSTG
jgi:signal transduction histidine kinase